ncbi:MAG TPA: type II secretion system protein GspM [Candidatus Binataceae bacterium]|nr:type II secretion system protein GspM [Candidatus Binataceae bacterium]
MTLVERLRNLTFKPPALPVGLRRLAARAAALTQPLEPWFERAQKAIAPLWEAAATWFDKREPREKLLLRVLGAIVAVLVLYGFVYSPIVNLRQSLADRVITRRNDLLEVRRLVGVYERLQGELAAAQHRTVPNGPNFSLFSVVEQSLTKSVNRDRIVSLTPADHAVPGGFRQYTVEVKLTNITLPQVVDSLYGVQSLPMPVTVSNLQIRPHASDTHSYDVDMTCMALGKD